MDHGEEEEEDREDLGVGRPLAVEACKPQEVAVGQVVEAQGGGADQVVRDQENPLLEMLGRIQGPEKNRQEQMRRRLLYCVWSTRCYQPCSADNPTPQNLPPNKHCFYRGFNQQPAWTQPKPSKSYQWLHVLFSDTFLSNCCEGCDTTRSTPNSE